MACFVKHKPIASLLPTSSATPNKPANAPTAAAVHVIEDETADAFDLNR